MEVLIYVYGICTIELLEFVVEMEGPKHRPQHEGGQLVVLCCPPPCCNGIVRIGSCSNDSPLQYSPLS